MDIEYLLTSLVKILAGIACGFLLGIERKSHNNIIGMRTLILICVTCTLLGELSSFMALQTPGSDGTRISAGVVSGIGFLGGGAILRQGLNIKGLTSAAIIWTASALGLSIGTGMYVQSAAVLVSILVLLVVLEKVEESWFPAGKIKALHLTFEDDEIDTNRIKDVIEECGIHVTDLNLSRVIEENRIFLHYTVRTPRKPEYTKLVEKLKTVGKLSEFSLTD